MGPIDYSTNVASPFASAMQGFQGGLDIRNAMDAEAQKAVAIQQAQQQQADLQAFSSKPNRTAADYGSIIAKYPQLGESLSKGFNVENPAQKQSRIDNATQVYAAVQSGNAPVAVKMLRDQADAQERAGDAQGAAGARAQAHLIELNPDAARTTTGLALASVMGPDKFADMYKGLGEEKRAEALAPSAVETASAKASQARSEAGVADVTLQNAPASQAATIAETQSKTALNKAGVGNIASEITNRAQRLGLDRDTLLTNTQLKLQELQIQQNTLPAGAVTVVNEAAANGVTADHATKQYNDLAARIEDPANANSFGTGSATKEFFKRQTGQEDFVSGLKREYTRMASQGVIKLLPPGPASDKDIENAKAGIPDANASPQVIASYLRGMAKLSAYDAALNNAKAEWVAQNHHAGNATRDMNVSGVQVPKGMTFSEFSRRVVEQQAASNAVQSTIKASPYAGFASQSPTQPAQTAQAGGAGGSY